MLGRYCCTDSRKGNVENFAGKTRPPPVHRRKQRKSVPARRSPLVRGRPPGSSSNSSGKDVIPFPYLPAWYDNYHTSCRHKGRVTRCDRLPPPRFGSCFFARGATSPFLFPSWAATAFPPSPRTSGAIPRRTATCARTVSSRQRRSSIADSILLSLLPPPCPVDS